MRLLDRIVQAMLFGCMAALAGYIILKGIAIAGENGVFQNTPVLSAIYRNVEKWSAGTVVPVISYVQISKEEEQEKDWFLIKLFPLTDKSILKRKRGQSVESTSEYELIVRAEAMAEEHKQPVQKSETEENKEADQNETKLYDYSYLLNHYFSMDVTTTIDDERLDGRKLLSMDLTLEQNSSQPQILIYHTHSQEAFADSVEGDPTTTIVGVGECLKKELETYGYTVIHETGVFDLVDGVLDRNLAYDFSERAVKKILEEYPSIEVVIDLHRDGVDGTKFVTTYQGKPAAKLMFIVGMSRMADNVDIPYLPNPYIEENLAFALQMQLLSEKEFPDLMRNIYLMAYRFNMHLRPRSILLEAGTQLNTVEEEKNAMKAFASLLDKVLRRE